ncbi:MAG: hypothetical protein BroJett015_28020 [Chloroflexota bacterium]|nr:hypothetical protein [Ardenticatenaceae bacterium]MBL1130582.1 hypothetical protein [Chloroflexota bacterium]GIK57139.1 MAG: hypothetical protein BroJett015_28020 [Chloroflexota bacterium]
MANHPYPDYLAYLVRLWHEGEGVWRSTVENPHTGERHAFADVEALFVFMRRQLEEVALVEKDDWGDGSQ